MSSNTQRPTELQNVGSQGDGDLFTDRTTPDLWRFPVVYELGFDVSILQDT
ncbi:hypothetical protein CASFOL_033007 [Castilleja foliolosa]|uniref:Uncharacterized protein n=1 Tax=Castilleja foliolosa TaxID=1961234 RepID=A0ABD3C4X5_9LAMI